MKITREKRLEMIKEELDTLTERKRFPKDDIPPTTKEFVDAYMQLVKDPLRFLTQIISRGWTRGKGPVSYDVYAEALVKAMNLEDMIKQSTEMAELQAALKPFSDELNKPKVPISKKS